MGATVAQIAPARRRRATAEGRRRSSCRLGPRRSSSRPSSTRRGRSPAATSGNCGAGGEGVRFDGAGGHYGGGAPRRRPRRRAGALPLAGEREALRRQGGDALPHRRDRAELRAASQYENDGFDARAAAARIPQRRGSAARGTPEHRWDGARPAPPPIPQLPTPPAAVGRSDAAAATAAAERARETLAAHRRGRRRGCRSGSMCPDHSVLMRSQQVLELDVAVAGGGTPCRGA